MEKRRNLLEADKCLWQQYRELVEDRKRLTSKEFWEMYEKGMLRMPHEHSSHLSDDNDNV
jgi:hypothetical protein